MNLDFFKYRNIVIATKHKKEQVIKPLIYDNLGANILIPENFDSDLFGTFTLDIKRDGNQLEAARKKALQAMELVHTDIALSSEGSFGPHRDVPFVNQNFELVLLVDKKNNIEIRGHHRSLETNFNQKYVSSLEEALEFAKLIGFPEHGVIVRPNENSKEIYKELETYEELEDLARELLKKHPKNTIFLETDMRAHRNPTRMKNIEKATEDLIRNIKNTCPSCTIPGFVPIEPSDFLVCSMCGLKSETPSESLYECQKCKYSEKRIITNDQYIDPGNCQNCNP